MAHKQSIRKTMQKALAHKGLANLLLEALVDLQSQMNQCLTKLDADNAASLDVDYNTLEIVSNSIDGDESGLNAGHKATWRRSLRSVLKHKGIADEILDSIEELQTAFNLCLAKLDAEAGTLDDANYESLFAINAIDAGAN